MKKFILKLIPLFLIAGMFVGASVYIDPFNVFHPLNIRSTGCEPNKNYVKMYYILENPDKFDAFIFGSSRVGALHPEKIEGVRCYNMTSSGALPRYNMWNIQTMIENDIIPKRIYIGVDSLSYSTEPDSYLTKPMQMPYEYLAEDKSNFLRLYCDPEIMGQYILKRSNLLAAQEDPHATWFYDNGSTFSYGAVTDNSFANGGGIVNDYDYIDEVVDNIRTIRQLCDENGIELYVFTNPMYCSTYKLSLERGYLEFLEKLADASPFYNFSSLNDLSTDPNNYLDESHYKPELGDIILACMGGEEVDPELYAQGFGFKADSENIDELLDILENQDY